MILLTLSRGKGEETVRLQLPASPAEIGETFAFLDRISLDTTATAILDVSSNVPVLYRCLYDVDVEDSEQFQKLQKLAERTEALSPAKAAIFSGALDAECVWNLEGALTVADRLDEYMLVNNVSSDSELGIYLVNKGITPFPDRFKPYINYARVGAEYREKHGGEYSSGNYVQKKTPELLENERLDGVFRIWMENPCPVRVQSETAQITLPATFEQLESARQLLGVDSLNMAKLTRVEALRPYLGEYLPLQGMDLRLEQLDELAENIRIMDQEDGALLKYLSVLEVEQPATLQEALRFSIELDDYERVPDDPEEYGKQVLERIGADEELISIINLPHPTSAKHPRMPLSDRAAQFAPFAALSGHSAALVETARLTDQRMELDEDARAALDSKQQLLLERIKERPEITVTWFQPDAKKDGGRYIVSTGRLKRIHEADQVLILVDGLRIPIGDIVELESECIRGLL